MDVAFDGDGGQRILTSVVDLTSMVDAHNKERRLRRQLAGAQRLEALGRLAGGVAHDMNNILSALGNNVELIYELREEEPAEARMCLDDARASLSRGTALMEQLLAFRGRRARGTTNADASAVVDGLERLLRSLVPADRKMELTLSPTGAVQLEQTRLEQIVVNLVMNGSDACGPGGSLEISIRPSEDGQDCLLTVKDDGPGIDADVQQNIFDPFFTTKTLGNGTGLGLSTVKGLVDDADGEIRLETGPAGTTFHVRLPLSSKAAPAQALSPRGDAPAGAGRTMVLVDDDGAVRRSVARQLIRAGWQVEQYGDPLAALARLVGPEPPPDILVSDVVMPSLNGRQLVEAVRAEHPALPVLFISGYTGDVLGERVFQDAPLLFKPFAVEDLLAQVDVLAGARVEPAEDA
jgi:nitrogen-specific signal transduction histidine kinase